MGGAAVAEALVHVTLQKFNNTSWLV